MKKIVIAIDGYSSCGKSTTARLLARQLGYTFIDSGSMYRAFTLYLLENHIPVHEKQSIIEALASVQLEFHANSEERQQIYLNGECVESRIRGMDVSRIVSEVSTIAEVRKVMVTEQKRIGARKGVVMDGRDIGTVVFPEAELKIFMKASVEERVRRRLLELEASGVVLSPAEVKENLLHRDFVDTTRKESPLTCAPDAIVLDNTGMTIDEQVQWVAGHALRLVGENQLSSN